MRWTPLLLVAALGCQDELPGHSPVARITATPRAIPDHDGYQTDVVLDGSRSADPIDDPDGGRPLTYAWEITNDDVHLEHGNTSSMMLTIRLLGAHPATVHLTVTDEDGQSSTARLQLQLTLPTTSGSGT